MVMMTQECQVASDREDHFERTFRVRGLKLEGVRPGLDQAEAFPEKGEKQRRNRIVNCTVRQTSSANCPLLDHSIVIPICLAAPGFSRHVIEGELLVAGFGRRQLPHCLTDKKGPEQESSFQS